MTSAVSRRHTFFPAGMTLNGSGKAIRVLSRTASLSARLADQQRLTPSKMSFYFAAICTTRGIVTILPSILMFAVIIIGILFNLTDFSQAGYRVIPFVPGYDDIAGNILKLDHIVDPHIRPLDALLRDHFLQGVLKNMKGASEPTWDYEDALGGGMVDLSRSDLWGGREGQAHLEFEMAHRLHGIGVEQESLS